ncbi:hypothetical protein DFA_10001 [Cavenderia fasciculata]|uniref:Transmembrane protein n=1 Tax=Cavenderia fasciculata TaxID=261658 RepID=F4Q906_CACFS|nr:uncharacterized protein DFA_10001 [Cavenderia fasciculata]EGG15175.1 hypothetical protein DFA_10001 [Cavenderia fasciculata]|eukprot:XP_004351895.1 hypothetical protein DFA_10001 [Cavenderia fasciculata]
MNKLSFSFYLFIAILFIANSCSVLANHDDSSDYPDTSPCCHGDLNNSTGDYSCVGSTYRILSFLIILFYYNSFLATTFWKRASCDGGNYLSNATGVFICSVTCDYTGTYAGAMIIEAVIIQLSIIAFLVIVITVGCCFFCHKRKIAKRNSHINSHEEKTLLHY